MFIDKQMDKEDVVFMHKGILLNHKKGWHNVIYSNLGVPKDYHILWSKSKT